MAKKKAEIQKIYRLTPMQEGMLYHALLDQDSPAYYEQITFYLKGDIDIEVLEQSFNKLIRRYDILRTIFKYQEMEEPIQIVLKERNAKIRYEDITAEAAPETYLAEFKKKDRERGFNLAKDLLIRLAALKTGNQRYQITWSFHHILMDGWCISIIYDEFFKIYQSLIEHQPLNLPAVYPYSDYIKWLEQVDQEVALSYWEKYLEGYEATAGVPKDSGPEKPKGLIFEEYHFTISQALTMGLENLARLNHVSLSTVFQTMWGILLQKYNDTNDVVYGLVVSGRPPEVMEIEKMVGLFINAIPLRIKLSQRSSFESLIREVHSQGIESTKNSYISLAQVQTRTFLKQRLFDNIMVFENYPIQQILQNQSPGTKSLFEIYQMERFEQTNYDFTLIIIPGTEIGITISYNGLLYRRELIRNIQLHLGAIIQSVAANPAIAIQDIRILSPEEKQQLLEKFNNTRPEYPKDKTIHQVFEEQVRESPENIALVFHDRQLTYRELNEKANQLAKTLRNKGVEADCIVGIMAERSLEMIVGIMGILKAGGAYLPIDTGYPSQRIQYMLTDSGAKLLLTQKHLSAGSALELETLYLEEEGLDQGTGKNFDPTGASRNLAYIIYTSGSTGAPKGNLTTHANVLGVVKNPNYITITPEDTLLQLSNYAFDGSVFDIFGALLNGAKLVLVEKETVLDVKALAEVIEKHQITVSFMTTALFNTLVDVNIECFKNIRKILFGGERVSAQHVWKAYQSLGPGRLIHVYGPTETTVFATHYLVDDLAEGVDAIPIGKPLSNTKLYVLDKNNLLQPVGVPGELCISGDGAAQGYLNRPELTAEKFVSNPFFGGVDGTHIVETLHASPPMEGHSLQYASPQMYRTGDLVRWLPEGVIEFLGRIDHQVKIRGFRIELGEIESRLLKHPAIKEAVVIDKGDPAGTKYLGAYFIANTELTGAMLREYLVRDLPDYMIPSFFVQLEKLPLTPNGKVDRRSLVDRKAFPEPSSGLNAAANYVAPANPTEAKLVDIWQEILGIGTIGVQDNFFELGGHSLKAVALAARIHKEFNTDVPLLEIFSRSTIRGIGEYLNTAEGRKFQSIQPLAKQDYYPASSTQKRLFFLNRLEGQGTTYNMPFIIKISGKLDPEKLENVFQELVNRHESLRTGFSLVNNQPVQRIIPEVNFKIEYKEDSNPRVHDIIRGFIRPFDISQAPLLRVGLVKQAEDEFILICDLHHIVCDGVSMGILVKEFIHLYDGGQLPALRIQYKDYSAWQASLFHAEAWQASLLSKESHAEAAASQTEGIQPGAIKNQEEYWVQRFAGKIPVLDLPMDWPRPLNRVFEGDQFSFTVNHQLTDQLRRVARETGATVYMILLAAFHILLARYSGQEDIIIGVPIAGRPHTDLDNIIGMFVNTLAVRCFPEGKKTLAGFLREVKDEALNAYQNQDYPLDELLDKLNITRDPSRNPLFDVVFVSFNTDLPEIRLPDLTFSPYPTQNKIAKFDLTLQVDEEPGFILFGIEYCTRLFAKNTIEQMADDYLKIIAAIAGNTQLRINEIQLSGNFQMREKAIQAEVEFDF